MSILNHNEVAAARWGAGGKGYDQISAQIADAIDHCVERLAPHSKQKILDIATGTGWTARVIAERGAAVTGIDIAEETIEGAKEIAGDKIDFRVGDAEKLAFEDTSFDGATSTFGVQFVSDPEASAAEVARVLRPGGKFATTVWTKEGAIPDLFKVISKYMDPKPDPAKSPFLWGTTERLSELFGDQFAITVEPGTSMYREATAEDCWTAFSENYGPVKQLAASLDEEKRAEFRQDFIEFHEKYRTADGIVQPRNYLLLVATKR